WVTTPVDVVKTRIMLSAIGDERSKNPHVVREVAGKESASQEKTKRWSGFRIGREIWRAEGVRGLWKGGTLRGLWTAVGSGLYLGVYETGRAWLCVRRGKKEGDAL